MATFVPLLDFLVAHGPTVALGASIVLIAGCGAMACSRRAADRRRLGVLTALACSLYFALAWLPLPRWSLPSSPQLVALPALTVAAPALADAPVPDPGQRAAALLAALDRLELSMPGNAASPAQVAVVPASPWTVPRLLAAVWLALAVAVLLRALLGLFRLAACLRTTVPGPAALLAKAPTPRGTRLCIADAAVRPFCAVWGRPVIVLPRALLAPERAGQALAVVRHEAAHLRARDPWVQLLLSALAVLLAWHPLFWWLARDVRFHAELLADDAAAAATGRAAYARELLDLAEQPGPALAAAGAVPVFHRPSEFFRRIQMLLQREGRLASSASRLRRFTQTVATAGAVVAIAGLLGVPASAQDPEPSRKQQRQENDRLRAELEALRAELKALHDLLEQQRQAQQPGVPLLQDVPVLGNLFRQPAAAAADGAPPQNPLAELDRFAEFNRMTMSDATRGMLIKAANIANSRAYVVKQGDSLQSIARQELGSPDRAGQIAHLNPGVDAERLRPGQEIRLPAAADRPTGLAELLGPKTQDPPATPPPSNPVFLPDASGLPTRRVELQLGDALLADQLARSRAEETAQANDRALGASTTEAVAELTTRCLDLQAELEVAEVEVAQLEALAKHGTGSTLEAKRATIKLASMRRKLAIVQQLIDGEINASGVEIAWLERKLKEADKTDRLRLDVQVQRAKTRIAALKAAR